jgi:DNA-binding NarL/FixJ family response regulator
VSAGPELIREAARLQPDAVIADVTMPEMSGIEATRVISKTVPGTKVILLSMHADALFVAEGLRAGASGYVLKRDAPDVLIDAIRTALRGKIYIPPALRDEARSWADSDIPIRDLTDRQRQVLQLVAEGHSLKEIAARLQITQKTVEFHKYKLMRQLHASTTAELTAIAITHGFVGSDAARARLRQGETPVTRDTVI